VPLRSSTVPTARLNTTLGHRNASRFIEVPSTVRLSRPEARNSAPTAAIVVEATGPPRNAAATSTAPTTMEMTERSPFVPRPAISAPLVDTKGRPRATPKAPKATRAAPKTAAPHR
jgi:hypothetical protein